MVEPGVVSLIGVVSAGLEGVLGGDWGDNSAGITVSGKHSEIMRTNCASC